MMPRPVPAPFVQPTWDDNVDSQAIKVVIPWYAAAVPKLLIMEDATTIESEQDNRHDYLGYNAERPGMVERTHVRSSSAVSDSSSYSSAAPA